MKYWNTWEIVHRAMVDKIVQIFISNNESSVKREKVTYFISYSMSEFSKFILWLALCYAIKKTDVFLIIYFCVASLRMFTGGTHKKTMLGCFMYSTFVLGCIYVIGQVQIIKDFSTILYIITLIIIWKCTPIVSKNRIPYSAITKVTFKAKALTVLILLQIIMQTINKNYKTYIIATIIMQDLDIILQVILQKKEGKNV